MKPRHLPTLRLLDFPTFLSLMFRAIDKALSRDSINADMAAKAVRVLIRELTRQYESLVWSGEPVEIWMFNAYLRWTHMVQTRKLCSGFNSEHAFLSEARRRCRSGPTHANSLSTRFNPSPLIHNTGPAGLPRGTVTASTTAAPYANKSSHWFICPCCGIPNDHFSPACPSQSNGPKPVQKFIQDSTRATIDTAPIPQSAKTNLARMATSLYAKLAKSL